MKTKLTLMVLFGLIIQMEPIEAQLQTAVIGFNNNSWSPVICKPGTVTLNANIYSGYGCVYAWPMKLEYRPNSSSSWTTIKTYTSGVFTGTLSYDKYFSDDLSSINLYTGEYRFEYWRSWEYDCFHCYAQWCSGPEYAYLNATFLYNDAGPNKQYQPNCLGRAYIGLPSNIGSNNTCTPTYEWTPIGFLYNTASTQTPCSPCTNARVYAQPTSSPVTYTRTMTCGGNVCTDQVVVTINNVSCRTGESTEMVPLSSNIIVSPNPSRGHFTINSEETAIDKVMVFDMIGKKIIEQPVENNSVELLIDNPGTYNVVIMNQGQKLKYSKIIVN